MIIAEKMYLIHFQSIKVKKLVQRQCDQVISQAKSVLGEGKQIGWRRAVYFDEAGEGYPASIPSQGR